MKLKFRIFSTFLFSIIISTKLVQAQAPEIQWAQKLEGENKVKLAVDGMGNVFAIGNFDYEAVFGTDTLRGNKDDILIVKYDTKGNLQWKKAIGGTGEDLVLDFSADGKGNLYLTGSFTNTINFGNKTLNTSSANSKDVFVANYDQAGNLKWAQKAGGKGVDSGTGIDVDSKGNTYVSGVFQETADFGNNHKIINKDLKISAFGVFVAKYNSSGLLEKVQKIGNNQGCLCPKVAVDKSGNLFVTGNANVPENSSEQKTFEFLTKYNSSGKLLWTQKAGGSVDLKRSNIALDEAGNAYLTVPFYNGSVTFGSKKIEETNMVEGVLITKYNSTGTQEWLKLIGETSSNVVYSIAVDKSGNAYITGDFENRISIDNKLVEVEGENYRDIFAAKLNTTGNLLWVKTFGGTGNDEVVDIAVNNASDIYLTGLYDGNINFDSTTLKANDENSENTISKFIIKLGNAKSGKSIKK